MTHRIPKRYRAEELAQAGKMLTLCVSACLPACLPAYLYFKLYIAFNPFVVCVINMLFYSVSLL